MKEEIGARKSLKVQRQRPGLETQSETRYWPVLFAVQSARLCLVVEDECPFQVNFCQSDAIDTWILNFDLNGCGIAGRTGRQQDELS